MNDKQEITDLVALYADGVNRNDLDAWAEVWTQDCEYFLDGQLHLKGRDAVLNLFSKSMANADFMYQLVHSGVIDVDGKMATGRWYVSEYRGLSADKQDFVIGLYQDRYAHTDAGWKFSERRFNQIHIEPRRG